MTERIKNLISLEITLKELLDYAIEICKANGEKNNPTIEEIAEASKEIIKGILYLRVLDQASSQENKEEKKQAPRAKRKPTWDEWKKFWSKINALNLKNEDVHKLLGVESVKDLIDELTLDEIYQIIVKRLNEGGDK